MSFSQNNILNCTARDYVLWGEIEKGKLRHKLPAICRSKYFIKSYADSVYITYIVLT